MRLKPSARDRLLEDFATRLNAGAIVIYAANPSTNPLAEPLIEVPFQSPAFQPVDNGRVEAFELQPTLILRDGDARWAELVTANGEAISDVSVRAIDAKDAEEGDILVDRTDFRRGVLCTLTRVTLTLPMECA